MIIYDIEDFKDIMKIWNIHKNIVGFTSGCFDLIHPLHVEYLNKCARQCDKLFVFIDSDRLVHTNKNKYPLINENDRAYMVDNLESVSGVYIFDNVDFMTYLISSTPMNGKYSIFKHNSTVYGASLVVIPGIPNIIIPDIIRFQSTTEIKNFLKNEN